MKKFAIVLILFMLLVGIINAQDTTHIQKCNSNSVYVEFFGNGGYSYSLNYERLINKKNNLGIRFGFGYQPPSNIYSHYHKYYSIPLEIVYLLSSSNHHVELGAGFSYLGIGGIHSSSIVMDDIVFFTRIGYRYCGVKGLLIRVGFTPVIDPSRNFFTNRFPINPFAGVSIGYSF